MLNVGIIKKIPEHSSYKSTLFSLVLSTYDRDFKRNAEACQSAPGNFNKAKNKFSVSLRSYVEFETSA